ncbi:MAG: hypothetical protein JNJ73_01475 [Hyphomonadaceae bacterium]|nr:hypothetical protein [Hyphomonadaceae bacterium]
MRIGLLAAIALALAACSPPDAGKGKAEAVLASARAPQADETHMVGQVTSVEDGGYPQFTVHVLQNGVDLPLYLNAEAADLGGATPASFQGATAEITYRTTPANNLADLRVNGHSLLNGDAEPTGPSVTGVLSGASEVTAGDLPGLIVVTDRAGQRTEFEYYVTPEIVAANGKQVTAFYTADTVNRITAMRPAGR